MYAAFTPAIRKKAERWAIIAVAAMVGISVIATLWTSGTSLLENLSRIPWPAVGGMVLATIIQNLLRFSRYQVAATALRLHVPWYRHLYYFAVGFALLPTPGKVGMAIRLWLLKQYHNLPYSRTAPLMVMDLVSDAIAMLALISVSLIVLQDSRLHTLGLITGIALAMGLLLMLVAPRLMLTCVKVGYWLTGRRKRRLFARLLGIVRTMAQVFGPRVMLTTIALSFAAWGVFGWAVTCLITGFGITSFGLAEGVLAINLSNIGGFISMMPAGMGGAELGLGSVFSMFEVPFGITVIAVIIVRVIDVWLPVLLGFLLLPIALRNAPKLDATRPTPQHRKITHITTRQTEIVETDDAV